MSFATSIHCMDGKIQLPLISYIKNAEKVDYVDSIAEPGFCRILPHRRDRDRIRVIRDRLKISLYMHESSYIYVSGHHDCAGNAVSERERIEQIIDFSEWLQGECEMVKVVGVWITKDWKIDVVRSAGMSA